MPEQPQWPERTLDMPPQDPWAQPQTSPQPYSPAQETAPYAPAQHPTTQHGAGEHPTAQQGTGQQGTGRRSAPHHPSVPPFQQGQQSPPDPSPFSRGRAQVSPRTQQFNAEHEPTGTGWPAESGGQSAERHPLSWHIRRLRRGSEWSNAPLIFAFISWGIWVLSSGGSMVTPVIVFITSLCVAAGVFALARLAGRLVLERQLGRVRHTARGAHMITGVFLIGVGLAHLQQTEWVVNAVSWVTSQ